MSLAARLSSVGVVLLAGLAQALAIATPWDGQPLWWLQILSLAVLAWQVQVQPSWQRAVVLGWAFATAWLCGIFWWLFISMHVYGGLASPLAVLAILGLAAFLSSYYAAACAVFRALMPGNRLGQAVLFASLWLMAELARVTWFTGFPWGAGGYAHVQGPLAAWAPWVGVHGIGLIASMLAYGMSLLVERASMRSSAYWMAAGAALVVMVAGNLAPQPDVRPAGDPLRVALLQGNIPQDEKFQGGTGVPLALQWYATQLRQSTASLLVAPETAVPLLPQELPQGYLEQFGEQVGLRAQAMLIGIPLGDYKAGYTNSVIGIRAQADVYRYDKHHLVPFGEFIPPLFRWFTNLMNIPLGDFNRGAVGQPSFEWQGQRLAPNICYEDLFGEELGARFAAAATAPTIFVNFSNIGWFGNTLAIDQHLLISRMRAIEFSRPMIRATNTGATVVIDHRGVVTASLPRYTRGVLNANVQGQSVITLYAWWVSRLGLWPLWALGLAAVTAAYFMRTRRPGRACVT